MVVGYVSSGRHVWPVTRSAGNTPEEYSSDKIPFTRRKRGRHLSTFYTCNIAHNKFITVADALHSSVMTLKYSIWLFSVVSSIYPPTEYCP